MKQPRRNPPGGWRPPQPGQRVKLDMSLSRAVVCKVCGCPVFAKAFTAHMIPGIANQTGKDIITMVENFRCLECGLVRPAGDLDKDPPEEIKHDG